jgi:hypothetical protein
MLVKKFQENTKIFPVSDRFQVNVCTFEKKSSHNTPMHYIRIYDRNHKSEIYILCLHNY